MSNSKDVQGHLATVAAGKDTGRQKLTFDPTTGKLRVVNGNQADLTVSKKPGTSNRIEIHFAVFNHLYLCFSFMKLAETL